MRIFIHFENKPLLFEDPEFLITCADFRSLASCFGAMERALKKGYYLAGFLSYEAGYGFEECLHPRPTEDFPLVYLGAYRSFHRSPKKKIGGRHLQPLQDLRLNISYPHYASAIDVIRDSIARGDVYQITYCIKLLFSFKGDTFSLYQALLKSQPVPYPAYIATDRFSILSCSPELFMKKRGTYLVTKPMKGTWLRGRNIFSDIYARYRFQYDKKNRAENLMITDLLRNDLGRLGKGIYVPKLFEVTKYRTLYQMTSTVAGRVRKDIPLYELFASLFPSGSVTGAPKIRAMQIIQGLEQEPRKIYTGAIGYITPDKDLFFNIPIRTLLIRDGAGEMGIGGGIVWDSTPEGEWAEGLLKAKFLTDMAFQGKRI